MFLVLQLVEYVVMPLFAHHELTRTGLRSLRLQVARCDSGPALLATQVSLLLGVGHSTPDVT